jgi:hypothetical protein
MGNYRNKPHRPFGSGRLQAPPLANRNYYTQQTPYMPQFPVMQMAPPPPPPHPRMLQQPYVAAPGMYNSNRSIHMHQMSYPVQQRYGKYVKKANAV